MFIVDSTTSSGAAGALCLSSQKDAPYTDESVLVKLFCVKLRLQREATSPSSTSQSKQTTLRNPISRRQHRLDVTLQKSECAADRCPLQLVFTEVQLGHVVTDRHISTDRGLPQEELESPLLFVMVTDEILGGLGKQSDSHTFQKTRPGVQLFRRAWYVVPRFRIPARHTG